jgi:hypothetical protein
MLGREHFMEEVANYFGLNADSLELEDFVVDSLMAMECLLMLEDACGRPLDSGVLTSISTWNGFYLLYEQLEST